MALRNYVAAKCIKTRDPGTESPRKNMTLARLSTDGATFVKAVRCYAAAVLSFAQAMRNGVAAKCIKTRDPGTESPRKNMTLAEAVC